MPDGHKGSKGPTRTRRGVLELATTFKRRQGTLLSIDRIGSSRFPIIDDAIVSPILCSLTALRDRRKTTVYESGRPLSETETLRGCSEYAGKALCVGRIARDQ